MLQDTIREWLEAHPNVAGYVLLAGIYLSTAHEITSNSAGGGYEGP